MSGGDWKDMFGAACRGDVELVRHHLAHGVDPDHVHPEVQSTALVAALLAGHADVALLLLDHGADPRHVSPLEGQAPMQAAVEASATSVVERLRGLGVEAPPAVRATRRRSLLRRVTSR